MGAPHHAAVVIPTDPAVLGYIAGLIDGEGHITIGMAFDKKRSRHKSHFADLGISNTDERVITWLLTTVGGRAHPMKVPDAHPTHKVRWNWRIYAGNAEALLRACYPYLVVKADQADIIFKFRELRRDGKALSAELVAQREGLRLEIKALTRRGVAA